MNKRMYLMAAMSLVLAATFSLSHAYHGTHYWVKVSEQKTGGLGSDVICTWICKSLGESHTETTSGYVCPKPS
jgi:hypothetical protein